MATNSLGLSLVHPIDQAADHPGDRFQLLSQCFVLRFVEKPSPAGNHRPQGLRYNEIVALRYIHRFGPLPLRDFYRQWRFSRRPTNEAILYDLHRLGIIRVYDAPDRKGREVVHIQTTREA